LSKYDPVVRAGVESLAPFVKKKAGLSAGWPWAPLVKKNGASVDSEGAGWAGTGGAISTDEVMGALLERDSK
jgi:hypothetical protein